ALFPLGARVKRRVRQETSTPWIVSQRIEEEQVCIAEEIVLPVFERKRFATTSDASSFQPRSTLCPKKPQAPAIMTMARSQEADEQDQRVLREAEEKDKTVVKVKQEADEIQDRTVNGKDKATRGTRTRFTLASQFFIAELEEDGSAYKWMGIVRAPFHGKESYRGELTIPASRAASCISSGEDKACASHDQEDLGPTELKCDNRGPPCIRCKGRLRSQEKEAFCKSTMPRTLILCGACFLDNPGDDDVSCMVDPGAIDTRTGKLRSAEEYQSCGEPLVEAVCPWCCKKDRVQRVDVPEGASDPETLTFECVRCHELDAAFMRRAGLDQAVSLDEYYRLSE
ncbi:unnamed protein product, partial [Amoebophrya sp. A25]